MLLHHKIGYFILILLGSHSLWGQNKPTFKPYTIETTYNKLKKSYGFISPIQPLVSDKIEYKEDLVYKKINQRKLKLDVYRPKDKSKKTYPAVLLIHGGGWLTGEKKNQRVMAQHLALNGYVGITASYRLGLEAPYPAGVIDLKDAIKWIKKYAKKYHINPDKIAVLGASSGAQMATLIGVTPNAPIYTSSSTISDAVQAIINIDGIVSFIHPEASAEGKMASIWLDGTREENWENWKAASPLEYVDKNTPPTLFINSAQPRFHAGRDDMIALLKDYHIYNETHTLPDTPHAFWLMHPWFEPTLGFTVDFLGVVFGE
ncbi:alpha/beta hydrolase [Tamlana sp. I1]|uniref:alpha/beta hydrolase n=1 Tax=Tamlana sp. I1 TaxID=2762061 RepID=UPI00188FD733|nr:alpha/beta hydrolase [Tamlana sp. I1]